jgi:hypothetical protein
MDGNNLHDVFQSVYKAKHSKEAALLRAQNGIRLIADD